MNLSAESQRELERLMGLVTVYLLRHGQANRVELESALSALLEKLSRTEAEVDRLDGIRGELATERGGLRALVNRWATMHGEMRAERDEARRRAELERDARFVWYDGIMPIESLQQFRERHALPWELGAPAAGREEGTP